MPDKPHKPHRPAKRRDGTDTSAQRCPPRPFHDPEPPPIGEGRVTDGGSGACAGPAAGAPRRDRTGQRLSLPADPAAARPASRRATGIRNGEQET
ncbi:hypothetical protein A4G23_01588 [Streptomyces rubrolavendulae]|uniref:Uncharacterized protein n=1 Tax=Streptomyces rubrolavendulae TaxID=285473 RepID=A0A1D8FZY7_9ACTN|nr:hypothetical protein A4G23_01588 [Streptomyces rubrolavendulae]